VNPGLKPLADPRPFQAQTGAPHAFQVVLNLPREPVDCFKVVQPAFAKAAAGSLSAFPGGRE
jgi:hypothetical protein